MKLIIDIPDEMYDDIKHGYICSEYADTLIQLIPSSKPYEERPQGEWLKIGEIGLAYKCNKCDEVSVIPENFCPNCGAKMLKGS